MKVQTVRYCYTIIVVKEAVFNEWLTKA